MIRALMIVLAALWATAAAAQTPAAADPYAPGRAILADLQRIGTPRGVQETFGAMLGGARQVVKGRGAGRAFPLNDPKALAATLTIDRYRDDTIELIELVRRRYGQRNVLLVGHSLGSVVGLATAARRPDLFHAYIGMGQYIDPVAGERASFDWTLSHARRDGNTEAVRELEALRPYPGAFEIARIDAERKWAVHYGGLFAGRRDAQFCFSTARISPEYTSADHKAWSDGSAYSVEIVDPLLARVAFQRLRRIDCPVFMFVGRDDWLVPSTIAAAWLDRLTAPAKATISFENSAHMMMVEEPGRVLAALIEHALPLAGHGRAPPP